MKGEELNVGDKILLDVDESRKLLDKILFLTDKIASLSSGEFGEEIVFELENRERLLNIYFNKEHLLVKLLDYLPLANEGPLKIKLEELNKKKLSFLLKMSDLDRKIICELQSKADQTEYQLSTINKSKKVISSYIKNQVSCTI